jgi:RHS repeat-associated protein
MERLSLLGPSYLSNFERGDKQYELTNHLGNVLVTIADTKTAVADVSNSSLIDHYLPDVVTSHDYYPFGMLMPGRTNDELQQADADDAPTPIRVEAEDNLSHSSGIDLETTTDAGGGQNIVDINAGEYAVYWFDAPVAGQYLLKFRVAGDTNHFQFRDSSLRVLSELIVPNTGGGQNWTTITAVVTLPAGNHQYNFYSLSPNHWNLNWIEFTLRSVSSSSSSGATTTLNRYRYGFNGKEKDDEVKGDANQLDFGDRIYDPRLGRWLSTDPLQKTFAGLSPYNFCYNTPIQVFDADGRLGIYVEVKYNSETGKYTVLKITINDDLKGITNTFDTKWYNFVAIYQNQDGKDINYDNATPIQVKLLEQRTSTWYDAEWWAKWKVNDGAFEDEGDYGGIMWTSKDQTSGSEETKKGNPSRIENIDGLMAMVNGGKSMAGELEFDNVENMLNFLEKVTDLIKENSNSKPGDILDLQGEKTRKVIAELEALLSESEKEQISNHKITPKDTKPPDVHLYKKIYKRSSLDPRTDEVEKMSQNPSKPDTIYHYKYIDRPKTKVKQKSNVPTSTTAESQGKKAF